MAYSREQKLALLRYNAIDESRLDALTDSDYDDLLRRAGGNMPTIEGNSTENQADNAGQVEEDYQNRIAAGEERKLDDAQQRAVWEKQVHATKDKMLQDFLDMGYTQNQADQAARAFYGAYINRDPNEKSIEEAYQDIYNWKTGEFGKAPGPSKQELEAQKIAKEQSQQQQTQIQSFYNQILQQTGDTTKASQAAARFSALLQEDVPPQDAMAQVAQEQAPKEEPTPPNRIADPTPPPQQPPAPDPRQAQVQSFYDGVLQETGDPGKATQAAARFSALLQEGVPLQDAMAQVAQEQAPTPEPTPPNRIADPTPPPQQAEVVAPKQQPTPAPDPRQAQVQSFYDGVLQETGDPGKATQAAARFSALLQEGVPLQDAMAQVAQEQAPAPKISQPPTTAEEAFAQGGDEGLRQWAAQQQAGTEASDPNYNPGETPKPQVGDAGPPVTTTVTPPTPLPSDGASSLDNPAPGSLDAQPQPAPTPTPAPAKISDADFNDQWGNLNEQQRVEVFNSTNPQEAIAGFKRQPDPESGTWKPPKNTAKPAIQPAGQDKIAGVGGTKIVGEDEKPTFTQPDPVNTPEPFGGTKDASLIDTPAPKEDFTVPDQSLPTAPAPKIATTTPTTPTQPIQTYKPTTSLSNQLQGYFQGRIAQPLDSYGPNDDYVQRRKDLEAKRIQDAYDKMYENVRMDAINSGVYNGDAKIAGLFNVGNDQLDRLADQGESIELNAMDRRIADRNTITSQAMQFDAYDRELDRAISNDNWSNVEDLLTGFLTGVGDFKKWWQNRDNGVPKPTEPGLTEPPPDTPINPPLVPPVMPPVGTEPPPIGGPAPPEVVDPPFVDPGNPFEDDPWVGGGPDPNDLPLTGGSGGETTWVSPGGVDENGNMDEGILTAPEGDPSQITIDDLAGISDQNIAELAYQGAIPESVLEQWLNQASLESINAVIDRFESDFVDGVGDEPLGDPDARKVIDQLDGITQPLQDAGGRIADAGKEVFGSIPNPVDGFDPNLPLFGPMGEPIEVVSNAVKDVGNGAGAALSEIASAASQTGIGQKTIDYVSEVFEPLAEVGQEALGAVQKVTDDLINLRVPEGLKSLKPKNLGDVAFGASIALNIAQGDYADAAKDAALKALWHYMPTLNPYSLAIMTLYKNKEEIMQGLVGGARAIGGLLTGELFGSNKEQTVALPSYRVDPSQMDSELFGEIEYAISEGEKFGYDDVSNERVKEMLLAGEIALPERDLRDMVKSIYGEDAELEDYLGNAEYLKAGDGRHGGYADPNYNVNSGFISESEARKRRARIAG